MSSVTSKLQITDDLVWAYHGLLLAEIAKMRGIAMPLVPVKMGGSDHVYITGVPIASGFAKPEAALSIEEALLAAMMGLAIKQDPSVLDQGRPINLSSVSPGDAAKAIKELLDLGFLVIVHENICNSARTQHNFAVSLARTELSKFNNIKSIISNIRKILGDNICLKTYHGEMLRLSANASSLPDRYTVSDITLLPVLIEPKPGQQTSSTLPSSLDKFIKKTCNTLARDIIDSLKNALNNAGYTQLNTYQYKFLENYFSAKIQNNNVDAVLAAPTGGGKTIAFIIAVLAEVLAEKCRRGLRKAFIVYPRKTLEREQVENLATIVYYLNRELEKHGLGRLKIRILLRDGSSPGSGNRISLPSSPENIREITIRNIGSVKHWLDQQGFYHSEVNGSEGIVFDSVDDLPVHGTNRRISELTDIVVTNYYMLFQSAVRRAGTTSTAGARHYWFDSMAVKPLLLVMDEAHMVFGSRNAAMIQAYMLEVVHNLNLKPTVILSSATLLERKIVGNNTHLANIAGIVAGSSTNKGSRPEEAIEKLTGFRTNNTVYVDYYQEAWRNPEKLKLTVWGILYPSAVRKPLTALNEILVSLLHSSAALRGRAKGVIPAKVVAFIEYKTTLTRDLSNFLVNRTILEAGDVHDRVLLVETFAKHASMAGIQNSVIKTLHRNKAILEIRNPFINSFSSTGDFWQSIWVQPLGGFHALSPYLDPNLLNNINSMIRNIKDPEQLIENIIAAQSSWTGQHNSPWLVSLLRQAVALKQYAPWLGPRSLQKYDRNYKGPHLIVFHHGGFTGNSRAIADRLVSTGNPLLILATSTLEVGLNIPGVTATVLYILPREPGRALQMVGRSGREKTTLLTSMGIAVLRHNSWEIPKRFENEAVRYFLEVWSPPQPELSKDPFLLARLCATIGDDKCSRYSSLNPPISRGILDMAKIMLSARKYVLNLAKNINIKYNIKDICEFIFKNSFFNKISNNYNAYFTLRYGASTISPSLEILFDILIRLIEDCNKDPERFTAWNELYVIVRSLIAILEEIIDNYSNLKNIAHEILQEIYFGPSSSKGDRFSLYQLSMLGLAYMEIEIYKIFNNKYDIIDIFNNIIYPQPFSGPGLNDPETLSGNVIVL